MANVQLRIHEHIRNHFKRDRQGGIEGLRALGTGVGGSACALDAEQRAVLDLHLSAKAIAHWVAEAFEVSYTDSGMTAVRHRLGDVYKKPKLVPGKADRKAQEQFLVE